MVHTTPKITICIPHWQVKPYITICLRSIRKHSKKYNLEVIVVDNGSHDESLDYLRSLSWISLIERPEEVHTNWPKNVFTAWDVGIRKTKCDYFVTMHSDVFVKKDDWLDPFLNGFDHDSSVAGVGAWKLVIEDPLYTFQKRAFGYATRKIKILLGRKRRAEWKQGHYPRDYCAMYRTDVILKNNLTFTSIHGKGGGYSTARQIWDAGYKTNMIPVYELASKIVHIAHGTAAIAAEKPLHHRRAQIKVERKVSRLLHESWIKQLERDESLDR
jgi:glycosyltransferase involved in cell wall biosynthesis